MAVTWTERCGCWGKLMIETQISPGISSLGTAHSPRIILRTDPPRGDCHSRAAHLRLMDIHIERLLQKGQLCGEEGGREQQL